MAKAKAKKVNDVVAKVPNKGLGLNVALRYDDYGKLVVKVTLFDDGKEVHSDEDFITLKLNTPTRG